MKFACSLPCASKGDDMKTIKSINKYGLLAALLFSVPSIAAAGELYLIGHAGLKTSEAEVMEVFLGDKQMIGKTKVTAVDNTAAQPDFLKNLIKMDYEKYSKYWAKKFFRDGVKPPVIKSDDAATLSFIKSTEGAIGYVSSKPSGDVDIIKKY